MGRWSSPHGVTAGVVPFKRWSLLDLVFFTFLSGLLVFLTLVFTPLGDSIAAVGRRNLSPPKQYANDRAEIIGKIESGDAVVVVQPCGADDVDLMPCEDPRRSSQLSRFMNLYRERHCPKPGEAQLCLVPPPDGYRVPVQWPESLHKIWHDNMPYNKIADRKGHQGWMRRKGPYFIFPGGGTMFPDGAEQYIEKLGQYIPINDGLIRTVLDMGCGVASFGGFMLKKDILTLSFAPRDSHKSQIQFAMERGIPSFVAMLGTRRLPFPAFAFDLVHCSRCLIPFTAYNATYLIEVDRLLRPGGYLVISGPPVRWAKQENEWAALQVLARALCYELIVVDGNSAIWKKPSDAPCQPKENHFGVDMCTDSDNPSTSSYRIVYTVSVVGDLAVGLVPKWPQRLSEVPAGASSIRNNIGSFEYDANLWAKGVEYYKKSLGLKLGTPTVRNVMDMNASFGSFTAALISDPVWVMCFCTVSVTCAFGLQYIRCHIIDLLLEMDRILRPQGTIVIRDSPEVIDRIASAARAIRWTAKVHDAEPESNSAEKILLATKIFWKLPSVTH